MFFIGLSLVLGLLVLWLLFSRSPNISEARVGEFLEAQARHPGHAFEAGSAEEVAAIERIKGLLADLSPENVAATTREVYAENAHFNDTLKTLEGAEAIAEYLGETARTVSSIAVRFEDVARSGTDYYLRWVMDFEAPKLSGGTNIRTIGLSQIRFNEAGRVIFHQDYWDSTAGLFEHLPALNPLVHLIRRRL